MLATGYQDSGLQMLLVANATDVQYAPVSASGSVGTWTSARSGPAWAGQIAVDLDHDGYPEIVGYDRAQRAVCAVELTFGHVACAPTNETSSLAGVSILIGDYAGGAPPEIGLLFGDPTQVELAVVADITYDGSTLAGTAVGVLGEPLMGPSIRGFTLSRGVARKDALVVVSNAGYMGCALCN